MKMAIDRKMSKGSPGSRVAWEDTNKNIEQPTLHKSKSQNGDLKKVSLDIINTDGGGYTNPAFKSEKVSSPSNDDSRPATANSLSRKSAWERAQERYEKQERQMVQTKVRELAVDENALKEGDVCVNQKTCTRVFRSKKFKNYELERLYQRYFFKLSQTNLTMLMALVATMCIILITFCYVGGSTEVTQGIILGVIFITLISLEVWANRPSFDQYQLLIVAYIVMVLFPIIIITISVDADPRTASAGVWSNIFCINMVYILLPVRMRLSVLAGTSLAVIHIICSVAINANDSFLWKQVSVIIRLNLVLGKIHQ